MDYFQGDTRQQEQEELSSFENESMMCDSEDAPDDFQSGVSYVHIVHVDK